MNSHKRGTWRRLAALFVVCTLAFGAAACEKSPKQKLLKARSLVASEQNPEEAKKNLEGVLKAQPDNLEAKRLMGEVYRLQGDYEKSEKHLEKIWKENNFDKANSELSTKERQQKQLMESQFSDLYKDWAESLDPEEQPEKFAEVVRAGLEQDPKSRTLNRMLVDYYMKKGKRLEEEGEAKKAAAAFKEILELRTLPETRNEAKSKVRDLQLAAFKPEAEKRWNDKLKEQAQEADIYEVKDGTLHVTIENDLPRGFDTDNEEHVNQATGQTQLVLATNIGRLAMQLAGLPSDADLSKIENLGQIVLGNIEMEEPKFERRKVVLNANVPLDTAYGIAFDIKDAYEKAQKAEEEKAEEEKKKKAEAEQAKEDGEQEKAKQ